MINKVKDFLGFDIKEEKYKLSSDAQLGVVADAKKPDKWVFSTCGYCGVGCGLYIGMKDEKVVYTKGNPKHDKFIQLGLKANNFDGNTTLCMASAVIGFKQSLGSDGPVGSYEDFEKANTIFLIGANIADNHPVLKLHIAKNKNKPKIRLNEKHWGTAVSF